MPISKSLSYQVDAQTQAVVLDRSAFYPGRGGQPCDLGTLQINVINYPVEKVKKQGDDVLHFLGGTDPLPDVNSASHGTLDWARRHKLMRTHTALHILCGTVFRDYGALVTGGDLQADGGTHVANTSEIGNIKVVDYKSKGAINKRLYIEIE